MSAVPCGTLLKAGVMITFDVVREKHGWAVRMGERMTMPFWSRELAIREANCLADAIRCHGERAEVVAEAHGSGDVVVGRSSLWGRSRLRRPPVSTI